MSQVKFNFLNWRPDAEDDGHDGLVTADNVYHQPEGFKAFQSPTAGAFATNTSLGTCPSVVFRPVGTRGQYVGAWLHNATAAGVGYTIDMSVGLFSRGAESQMLTLIGTYTTYSTSTITNQYTGNNISALEVTEYKDYIFFTAEAQLPAATVLNPGGAPRITINSAGYAAI